MDRIWETAKPAGIGLVVGAIGFWAILGYCGWMSAGSAQALAAQQTHDALATYASAECVARFEQQPTPAIIANWRALQAGENGPNSYQFDPVKFLTKDAGANLLMLPGQKLSDDMETTVANSCAQTVAGLTEIGTTKLTMPVPDSKKT